MVAALANDIPSGTGVADEHAPVARFRAGLAWPNPAPRGALVSLPFNLPHADAVRLEIYDARGRLVARRAPQGFATGERMIAFDAADLPSGVYFTRFFTGSGLAATTRWVAFR